MKNREETWEIVRYLHRATRELNRCLLMAHDAGIKMTVTSTKNTYGQDDKQVEFAYVEVHVDPACLVDRG